jgi:hypothetical protein
MVYQHYGDFSNKIRAEAIFSNLLRFDEYEYKPMIKTFTPDLHFTTSDKQIAKENTVDSAAEPSFLVIQNILNFSKNLEVHQSGMTGFVEIIKS